MSVNVPVTASTGSVAPFGYTAPFGSAPFGGFDARSNWMTPFGGFDARSNWMTPFGGFDARSNWMAPFGGSNWAAPSGGFGGFDREFARVFRDMEKTFSSELNLQSSRPASMLEHYSLTNPIRIDAEGNRSLNCYFDMRSYKPEEINVTLDSKNRYINVEATHEVKDKEHYVKRHYSRKVYVPEDLKIDLSKIDLKSCLTNEGLLCVEAALPKLSLEEARAYGANKSISTTPADYYKIATKTI